MLSGVLPLEAESCQFAFSVWADRSAEQPTHKTAVCAWVEIQEGYSIQACGICEVGIGALSRYASGASSPLL